MMRWISVSSRPDGKLVTNVASGEGARRVVDAPPDAAGDALFEVGRPGDDAAAAALAGRAVAVSPVVCESFSDGHTVRAAGV